MGDLDLKRHGFCGRRLRLNSRFYWRMESADPNKTQQPQQQQYTLQAPFNQRKARYDGSQPELLPEFGPPPASRRRLAPNAGSQMPLLPQQGAVRRPSSTFYKSVSKYHLAVRPNLAGRAPNAASVRLGVQRSIQHKAATPPEALPSIVAPAATAKDSDPDQQLEQMVTFQDLSTSDGGPVESETEIRERLIQQMTRRTSLCVSGLLLQSMHQVQDIFGRYGQISSFSSDPSSNSFTVTYNDHDSAKVAYQSLKEEWDKNSSISLTWDLSKEVQQREASCVPSGLNESDAQAGPDRPAEAVPLQPNSLETEVSEDAKAVLRSLQHKQVSSVKEKYEVLTSVDAVLRKVLTQTRDEHSGALIGTCPDMCPEKERYRRIFQNIFSPFECQVFSGPSDVDERMMIKEYSRSSADQELPLPHELRPLPVLQRVMDYLCSAVMDLPLRDSGDWFNFIWDRTRAVRKDITQQQLCCVEAVEIVEKIARFHIYSSHALCEQNLVVFDPKINLDNLQNCFQTLSEFYSDLRQCQSKTCPNEAEIRCYEVLANLDNSEVTRTVMYYPSELLRTSWMDLAVKILNAYSSCNYIRFFHLFRTSPALVSCLMHRHINKFRVQSMRIIFRSIKPGQIRLEELVSWLGFDSVDEAFRFCLHLTLSVEDGYVAGKFVAPEEPLPPQRSTCIENKLTSSLGSLVQGGPVLHVSDTYVKSSFDSNGLYVPKDPVVLEFIRGAKETSSTDTGTPPKKPVDNQTEIDHAKEREIFSVCVETSNAVLRKVCLQQLHDTASTVYHEELLRAQKERIAAMEMVTAQVSTLIMNKTVESFLRASATEVYGKYLGVLRRSTVESVVEYTWARLLNYMDDVLYSLARETLSDFISDMLVGTVLSEVTHHNVLRVAMETLRINQHAHARQRADKYRAGSLSRRFFARWLTHTENRHCARSFPAMVSRLNLQEELGTVYPAYRHSLLTKTSQQFRSTDRPRLLLKKFLWRNFVLDVLERAGRGRFVAVSSVISIKLVFMLPSGSDSTLLHQFRELLQIPISQLITPNPDSVYYTAKEKILLTLKVVHGDSYTWEDCCGSIGFVLVVETMEPKTESEWILESCRLRNLSVMSKNIPVLILEMGGLGRDEILGRLDTPGSWDILDFLSLPSPRGPSAALCEVCCCLERLLLSSPRRPPVHPVTITSLLHGAVSDVLLPELQCLLDYVPAALPQAIQSHLTAAIVDLYNSVIMHIRDAVVKCVRDLWPPFETVQFLDLNCPTSEQDVIDILKALESFLIPSCLKSSDQPNPDTLVWTSMTHLTNILEQHYADKHSISASNFPGISSGYQLLLLSMVCLLNKCPRATSKLSMRVFSLVIGANEYRLPTSWSLAVEKLTQFPSKADTTRIRNQYLYQKELARQQQVLRLKAEVDEALRDIERK